MKQTEEYLNLSQNLLNFLMDRSTPDKKEELIRLLDQDEELMNLIERFKNKEYIDERLNEHAQIDLKVKWEKYLCKRNKLQRSRFLKQWLFKAASILIVLGTGLGLYNYNQQTDMQSSKLANISPDSFKVELIIENGNRDVYTELTPKAISE